MLQDIAPYEYNNDFAWVEPEPYDRVLVYRGSAVLASLAEGFLRFPTYGELCEAGVVGEGFKKADQSFCKALYLFTVGETAYFSCSVVPRALDELLRAGKRWQFVPTAKLHHHGPKHRAFAGLVGYEYHTWYSSRRFCGTCGCELEHDLIERKLTCPQCGAMEFPKLFPAVIVGIVDPRTDKVLVSRYANREYKRYALIAGFSEMGETVEQTVHREVMEEVGLKVKKLRYYKSQPWPPSSSLLFGFFCELDGSSAIKLDDHELESAEWIEREDLPQDDSDYSLTRDMMQVLRRRTENAFSWAEW